MDDMDSAHVRDVIVSNVSSIAAQVEGAIERLGSFAVAYRLIPFRDGNQWCVLLGDDIQSGVAGFGDSPAKAISAFERAMHTPISDLPSPPAVKESFTTEAPAAPAAQQPHRLKETSVVQSNNSAGPLSTQADTRAAAVERAAELAGRVAGEETANTIRHAGIVIGTNNECPTCKRY